MLKNKQTIGRKKKQEEEEGRKELRGERRIKNKNKKCCLRFLEVREPRNSLAVEEIRHECPFLPHRLLFLLLLLLILVLLFLLLLLAISNNLIPNFGVLQERIKHF